MVELDFPNIMTNQTIGLIAVLLFMIAAGVAGVDYGGVLKMFCQALIWMLFQVSIIMTAFAKSIFFAYIRFMAEYKNGCAEAKVFQQSVSRDLVEHNGYARHLTAMSSTTMGD